MLTTEIGLLNGEKHNHVVEMYFDQDGLDFLLDKLQRLKAGKTDHYNLMTDSWGDGDLSETRIGADTIIAHHLKLALII